MIDSTQAITNYGISRVSNVNQSEVKESMFAGKKLHVPGEQNLAFIVVNRRVVEMV